MKTAVDYLIQELFTVHDENFDFNPVFEKAKEMEKNQIINAYLKSKRKRTDFLGALKIMDEAEKYYNKTFKSE